MSKRPNITKLKLADRGTSAIEEGSELIAHRKKVNLIRVPILDVLPDHSQPRQIVPVDIKRRMFVEGKTCFWAAEKWRIKAASDMVTRERFDALVNLGGTIEDHGQIKPITGSWVVLNEKRKFLIESGERRFWSIVLKALGSGEENVVIEARVVEAPSAERQVIENRHAEAPTAVARACEIAKLVLSGQNILPLVPGMIDSSFDPFSYFKQVLDIKKVPDGTWDRVSPVMNLSERHMERILNILRLPTDLLELADQAAIPERSLRKIMAMPENMWSMELHKEIQKRYSEEEKPAKTKKRVSVPFHVKAAKRAKALVSLIGKDEFKDKLPSVAEAMVAELDSADDVLAAAEALESLAKNLRRLNSNK